MVRLGTFPRSGWVLLASACGALAHGQITTRSDAVGKLLNEWHAAGTAAGLAALTYENRDGGHSPLKADEWPQLKVLAATSGDKGPANLVRPVPLIGNCSMASSPTRAGSVPRIYMRDQQGFNFLATQYSANNHFVYPEHQDYDAGWNGRGGWGDLYPANLPCVTICQGSSYSDQRFVRAFLSATAALPPATQKLILTKQWLAPTLQMLLRRSYKLAGTDQDYFAGKTHPPVFNGDLLDEEKMVRLAHEMTPERIPPVVRLKVIGESRVEAGKHFFELDGLRDEILGTSPFAVARVFRASAFIRQVLVSATASADVKERPLTFKWALLQGDLSRVRIDLTSGGADAIVSVAWHPEMRAADGIQTHRVDIGVFASNGATWSAPALLSFYMLPNEARFYDARGNLEEICYDAGNPDPGLPPNTDLRWIELGSALKSPEKEKDPGIALLVQAAPETAVARLKSVAAQLSREHGKWRKLSTDPSTKQEADKALAALQPKLRASLQETLDGTGNTVAQAFEHAVKSLAETGDLYFARQAVIHELVRSSAKPNAVAAFTSARQRLLDYRILKQDSPDRFSSRVNLASLTAGEKYHLAQFHLTVLSLALLPEFLDRVEAPAYVDPHLTTPKPWRDVYHHDGDGKISGWTRIMDGTGHEFDAEGRLAGKDQTRAATPVTYVRDEKTGKLKFEPR